MLNNNSYFRNLHYFQLTKSFFQKYLTYKMNSGTFRTLNLLAVFTPRTSLSTRATFTRFFNFAPTASHTADKRWQSMHSRL